MLVGSDAILGRAMRLLLVKALDDAHVYSVSARALAAALIELGCEAELFEPQGDVDRIVRRLAQGDVAAVVSFSAFLGGLVLEDGRSIYDVLGVGFVGWQFDHPIYLDHQLRPAMALRRSIWPSLEHVRFAEAMGVGGRAAVGLAGAQPPARPPKSWSERATPLLVAATWNGRPRRDWLDLEDSPAKRLMAGVADRLLADPTASVLGAYRGTCEAEGWALPLDADVIGLLRVAFTYVRHHDRLAIIEALAASGLPLTVCGAGWEAALGEYANVSLRPAVPFAKAAALYDDARVVVNLNAGNGGCERAVGAAMAGAAVISDPSAALEAELAGALGVYDRCSPASAAALAAELLEGRGEALAQAGHAAACARSTWTRRAEGLLALLDG